MRTKLESGNTNDEADRKAASILDRLKQSKVAKGTAVALAGAALAGGMIGINHDKQPASKEKADQVAAVEIAKRFDCRLISLEDTGQEPTIEGIDPAGRTTVKVRVNISEVPEAKPYVDKYANSGAVIWNPPVVMGAVNFKIDELALPDLIEKKGPLAVEPYQETREETRYPAALNVEMYPKTDYPDGKQARIYVATSVRAEDAPEGDVKTHYEMNGAIDCGAMIFDGATRRWKMLPGSVRLKPIVKTDVSVFEDRDGDGVWNLTQESK